MKDLTKDAKKLLFALYKVYLDRRASGVSRSQSVAFEDSDKIQSTLFPSESAEDIAELCWELKRFGYINCYAAEDIANAVTILPQTIIAMENQFPDGVKQVVEAIAKISGIIATLA